MKAEWTGNTTHLGTINSTTLNSLTYDDQYICAVESNSTVLELTFNSTTRKLSFTATGSDGTRGYAKVTVPKNLTPDNTSIKAYLDGSTIACSITPTIDSLLLTLSYMHSTHRVTINLGSMPPSFIETPLGRLTAYGIPLTLIIAAIIVYAVRRKHKNH